MKERAFDICVADLGTEDGITAVTVQMAAVIHEDLLQPVLGHTPPHMRQSVVERFFSAVVALACNEVGHEMAKRALDEAKLALENVEAERARRRAH